MSEYDSLSEDRACELVTESRCFIVVIWHEVNSLMVSVIPVAVFISIVLCLHFCHGGWEMSLFSFRLESSPSRLYARHHLILEQALK